MEKNNSKKKDEKGGIFLFQIGMLLNKMSRKCNNPGYPFDPIHFPDNLIH